MRSLKKKVLRGQNWGLSINDIISFSTALEYSVSHLICNHCSRKVVLQPEKPTFFFWSTTFLEPEKKSEFAEPLFSNLKKNHTLQNHFSRTKWLQIKWLSGICSVLLMTVEVVWAKITHREKVLQQPQFSRLKNPLSFPAMCVFPDFHPLSSMMEPLTGGRKIT